MATSRATGRALARRLLEVSDLRKHYHARAGLFAALHGQTRSVPAVDGVSFALTEHETLGLVGRRAAERRPSGASSSGAPGPRPAGAGSTAPTSPPRRCRPR